MSDSFVFFLALVILLIPNCSAMRGGGGVTITNLTNPWSKSVAFVSFSYPSQVEFATGTLIHPRFVLTSRAAAPSSKPVVPIFVRVGSREAFNSGFTRTVDLVKEIPPEGDKNVAERQFGVLVLRFMTPIVPNEMVVPARLAVPFARPTMSTNVNELFVAGGFHDEKDHKPNNQVFRHRMTFLNFKSVANTQCKGVYYLADWMFVSQNMRCIIPTCEPFMCAPLDGDNGAGVFVDGTNLMVGVVASMNKVPGHPEIGNTLVLPVNQFYDQVMQFIQLNDNYEFDEMNEWAKELRW